jgi:hypothetical protein
MQSIQKLQKGFSSRIAPSLRRAARHASGLSADVIEGLDVEIVVEVEMRKR